MYFRNYPLPMHKMAEPAHRAAVAAQNQGKFWEMHDLLLDHHDKLRITDLLRYADRIGLDTEQFHASLLEHEGAGRLSEDLSWADLSGVSGTPTFFINGQRHYGEYDIATLSRAVQTAKIRARIAERTG